MHRSRAAIATLAAAAALAGCSAAPAAQSAASAGSSAARSSRSSAVITITTNTAAAPSSQAVTATTTASRTSRRARPAGGGRAPGTASGTAAAAAAVHPMIVIDPGHSRTVHAIDPRTGLDVSDYENEPEMRDVFAVARLVARRLRADGYRVVLTKRRLDERVSLGRRAAIANRVHAALALSIHDQAGANGGITYGRGNDIVYYQSVGTYRETPAGRKVYFTDRRVARRSRAFGRIFSTQRARVEHHPMTLQGNVGYDLGSRGLARGNIWLVQLLAHVPWIYNEAGGNSAGRVGLDRHDRHNYAAGLVAAVEHCLPR